MPNIMKNHASCSTIVAAFLFGFVHGSTVSAEVADLSQVEGLRVSADYRLAADDKPVTVLETDKATTHGSNDVNRMSFAGFDCDRETPVTLTVERAFDNVELRPRRTGIEVRRDGKTLSFVMKPTQQIAVVFDHDYENTLVVAANRRHTPPQPTEVEHYFAAGIHRLPERLALRSGDDVYLADDAVLLGAFDLKNVEDVRIFGRGIVYGGETPHQENYRVLRGDHTRNVTIEGITICNAPGWIISFWGGSENLTVRNVKMVGNFRYYTDGVQTGTNGLLVEDCFLQCNDDNFSLNGTCTEVTIRHNVLWNLYNGGVFMLGWGTGPNYHVENVRIHDNTVIRCGGCCRNDRKAPFSMKLSGSQCVARDIEFRNIVIEDIAKFGRWIDFQASTASNSEVEDIRFHDIQIDDTWQIEGEVHGMSPTSRIKGLVFDKVRIGDKLMDRPEAGQLSLIHTAGTQIQGKTFEDVVPAMQPIPEKHQ
ncbi:MAG TPA: glycosyl hydrolase family 28 protein [Thermoguttaceae bacterium]|nr:glycosyl hydrolase family 28 protein [Thermoguttaceae bacterium]